MPELKLPHQLKEADIVKKLIAGALGECVHVAGVSNFLRLAEAAGWEAIFLGTALPIEEMLEVNRIEKAESEGISYRLTPDSGKQLLAEFAEEADDSGHRQRH